MDVQCDRCKTEYEFDDALVSGRGTTVKCTNCGFQFKVHKEGVEAADDRWLVHTADGQALVFVALKDLQKAILAKQVGRLDTLSRGSGQPRALGAIAELLPFFEEQRKLSASHPPPVPPRRTPSQPPVDGGRERAGGTQLGMSRTEPVRATVPQLGTPAADLGPARERMDTLRPPLEGTAAAPPPPVASRRTGDWGVRQAVGATPQTGTPDFTPQAGVPAGPVSDANGTGPRAAVAAAVRDEPDVSSPLPAPTRPIRRQLESYDEAGDRLEGAMRAEVDSFLPSHRPGGRVGGWLIAAVLVGCVSVLGVIVARKYVPFVTSVAATKPEASAQLDPRAQDFLRKGERALDDGDLEGAKENFDKASVVAEREARVLLDLARLASVRADVPWLRLRIAESTSAPKGAPPDPIAEEARRALAELSAKAKSAADAALAVAPNDAVAVRLKMDALRIAGEPDQARAYVTKVIANAQQPETAYVLGALDLAEPEPLWKTVVERLRLATQAEGNGGRARAALVFALARSGDVAGAKAELDRLGQLTRPHPLYPALRAFVDRAPAKADAGAPAMSAPTVDVNNLPRRAAAPSGGGDYAPPAGDAKSLVAQGNAALGRRDYTRAEQLFAAALDKNPSDSEAQAGLGDVARAQHNLGGARASYQRATQINGHYLPALVGLADVEWDMGDHASAVKRYKDLIENFPEGALPAHVRQRAEPPSAPSPTSAADNGSP